MAVLQYGGIIEGVASTATSGGTTTLINTSQQIQIFTGSQNQTVQLPATNAFTAAGAKFEIYNESTGTITVTNSASTTLGTVSPGDCLVLKSSTPTGSPGTWVELATATAATGIKNYLSAYTASTSSGTANVGNGNFENGSTSGWALGHISAITNGIATGTLNPTGGSAGTLSLTLVSGGGALSGNYSADYLSTNATTVGDALVSSAAYIDSSDQGKLLNVSFTYEVVSGSSHGNWTGTSSASMGWAVYDVTNSQWLTTSNPWGMVQTSGVGYVNGTVQTLANTAQIRMVVYNANATTGNLNMYFDDFSIGPASIAGANAANNPTSTILTSGTSLTYTTPSGAQWLRIRMIGGGGGGGASGNGSPVNGSAGGSSIFGSFTAGGGGGGSTGLATGSSAIGGTPSANSGSPKISILGAYGSPGIWASDSTTSATGGAGGNGVFGGGGSGGLDNTVILPTAGATNSGGGGGGGGSNATGTYGSGGGGASGSYVETIISNPASSYTYTVGSGGAGGTANSVSPGGAGGSGIIIVEEFYTGGNSPGQGQIGATGAVALVVTGTSTSVGTSVTAITPTTINNDTNSGFSGSTYTCPITGFYQIQESFFANVSLGSGAYIEAWVIHNGTNISIGGEGSQAAGGQDLFASGSTTLYCNAGDTLKFAADASTGSYTPNNFLGSIFLLGGGVVSGSQNRINYAPTVVPFYSSGTTTVPSGVLYARVICVGGGGGGAGGGTSSATGSTGNTSSVSGTGISISASGGTGGSQANTGSGGVGSVTTASQTLKNIVGGRGMMGTYQAANQQGYGAGGGGNGPLGGGGGSGFSPSASGGGSAQGGFAGAANTGAGGGGGGQDGNANALYAGSGGSAGGYLEVLVNNPIAGSVWTATVAVAVSGGGAGTDGQAGGGGGSGYVEIWFYYQ